MLLASEAKPLVSGLLLHVELLVCIVAALNMKIATSLAIVLIGAPRYPRLLVSIGYTDIINLRSYF